MRKVKLMLSAAAAAALVGGAVASAQTTVVEYFNNYGAAPFDYPYPDNPVTDRRPLLDLGAAEAGWAAAWGRTAGGDQSGVIRPAYIPEVHLAHNSAWYNNLPNLSAVDSGVAGHDNRGDVASGQRVDRYFETPFTGTVWISALAQYSASGGDALLWWNFTGDATRRHFLALRSGRPVLRYGAADQFHGEVGDLAPDTPHLLLAKIEMPQVGNETVSFWVNPDLSGGEAGLGAPLLTASGGAIGGNIFSASVSFSFDGSYMDALRFSNAANGFEMVTLAGAPQPLQGDANRDGRVDGEDFLIWQANFGQQDGAYWEIGDFNGDGRVDGEDFLIWQANFGTVQSVAAVTPEPAALSLLGLAGLAMLRRRRG